MLIPEIVKQRWYQHVLHTHRARHLRSQLMVKGGPELTVISVPWRAEEATLRGGEETRPPRLRSAEKATLA